VPAMPHLTSCMIMELRAIAQMGSEYQPRKRCRARGILATLRKRGLITVNGSRDPDPGWKLTDEGRRVVHRLERQGVL
jgi:hypothetical protein